MEVYVRNPSAALISMRRLAVKWSPLALPFDDCFDGMEEQHRSAPNGVNMNGGQCVRPNSQPKTH